MNVSEEALGGFLAVLLSALGWLYRYMKQTARTEVRIDEIESKSTKDLDDLRATVGVLSGELIKVQSKTITLGDENKTLTAKLNEMEQDWRKERETRIKAESERDTLGKKNGELTALVEKQNGIIEAANKTIAEYEERHKKMESDHAAALHVIQLEKAALEGKVAGAVAVVNALRVQLPETPPTLTTETKLE